MPNLQFDYARIAIMPPTVQRKASISSGSDPFEREADEVADKLLRIPESTSSGSPIAAVQRKCVSCENEEKSTIQTKRATSENPEPVPDTGAAVRATSRGGAPLPGATRNYFGSRLGYDFSRVRVHTGSEAADAARVLQARAYTWRNHIVFGEGAYTPETGRVLIVV